MWEGVLKRVPYLKNNNKNNNKIMGITIIHYGRPVRFDYVEETDLYHYCGDTNYAGYTYEELSEMDERE